jgi:hypothetical protein
MVQPAIPATPTRDYNNRAPAPVPAPAPIQTHQNGGMYICIYIFSKNHNIWKFKYNKYKCREGKYDNIFFFIIVSSCKYLLGLQMFIKNSSSIIFTQCLLNRQLIIFRYSLLITHLSSDREILIVMNYSWIILRYYQSI